MSSPGIGLRDFLAERQGVEAPLDAQHEIVAVGVPDELAALDDIVEDRGDVG